MRNKEMAQVHRDCIVQLLAQLTVNYQNTKLERKQISQKYSSSEEDFDPLEEIEWLTVNIRGYACQIESTGNVKSVQQAIGNLQRLSLFNHHVIVQLYSEARSIYPQMYSYICMLDYVRLSVLEYLQAVSDERLAV
jgi:hypothetical protein